MRGPVLLSLASLLLALGCDGGEVDPGDDAGPDPTTDAGLAPADGGAGGDAGAGIDAGPDAGPVPDPTVRCMTHDGPSIIVTRDAPSGDETLLRLELGFEGGARGIAIDEVAQIDAEEAEVRRWDVATLAPPDGFTGNVVARDGDPTPEVIWTATTSATPGELAVCDQPWYQRAGGHLEVQGHTDAGPFTTTCSLSWEPRALDEALRFACARGIPGWLPDAYDALSDISTPIDAVIMGTTAAAFGNSSATITGFAATEADVRAHLDTDWYPHCTAPMDVWEIRSGMHRLWHGTSSTNIWSGPLAPGEIASFWWDYQTPGDAPSGFCVEPDDGTGPPEESCSPPNLQVVVRGTSSAGPWEWESDAFGCYLPTAP